MKHTLESQELSDLMDSILTKKEFLEAFKQVVETIKSHQSSNKNDLGAVSGKYDGIVQDIKKNYSMDMEAVKQRAMDFVNSEVTKMMSDHSGRMGKVESKITSLELNTPLRMDKQIKTLIDSQIKPLIPTQKQLDDRLPFLGTKIRDGLEKIKGEDEKLKIEAIGHLREELDKLEKKIMSRVLVGGGGGGVGSTQVHYKDLTSSLNGVLKTFSMPAFLRIIDVKLDGRSLRPVTDWTSDSGTSEVTLTSTISADPELLATQELLVLYVI